jgi:hypothetical protein
MVAVFLYWDDEKPELAVLCSGVSNKKSWIVQANAKKPDGKFASRRITIGSTNLFDRDQAWERAKPILAEIYDGRDPKVDRKHQQRASVTVEQVRDDFLAKVQLKGAIRLLLSRSGEAPSGTVAGPTATQHNPR